MEFPWLDSEEEGLGDYQLPLPSDLGDEDEFQMALEQGIHNSLAGHDMDVDPTETGLDVPNMWDVLSDDPAMFELGPPPESFNTLELPTPRSSADAVVSGVSQSTERDARNHPSPLTDRAPATVARDVYQYIPRPTSGASPPDIDYFILLTKRNVRKCFQQVRENFSWPDVDKLKFVRDEMTYILNSAALVAKRLRKFKVKEMTAASNAVVRLPVSSSEPHFQSPRIILVPPTPGKPSWYYPTRSEGSLDPSFLPEAASRSHAFDAVLLAVSKEDAEVLKKIHADTTKGKLDQLCVDGYQSTYEFEIRNARAKGLDPGVTNILYECTRFPQPMPPARRVPGIMYPETRARVRCNNITDYNFKYQFTASNARQKANTDRVQFILATMPTMSLPVDPTKLYPRELAALVAFRKFCWYGFHVPPVTSNLYPVPTQWGGVPCFLFEGRLWTPGARVCLLAYAATCSMLGYINMKEQAYRGLRGPTLWFFANYMMLNHGMRMLNRRALVKSYKLIWGLRDKSMFTMEQYITVGMLGLLDLSDTHRQLMKGAPAVVQLVPAICASTDYMKKKRNVIDAKFFDRLYGEYLTLEAQWLLPDMLGKLGKPSVATPMACAVPLNERGRYVLDEDTRNSIIKLGFPLVQQSP